jgi:hypothetical protein
VVFLASAAAIGSSSLAIAGIFNSAAAGIVGVIDFISIELAII